MNHEPKKECFKTSVGGQALMEGIMMRGPKQICCAVRKPDGTIETKIEDTPKHGIWAKIPIVRGAISMIESLITGTGKTVREVSSEKYSSKMLG